MAQVERYNKAFFVVSTLLSPLGMAYIPISWAIEQLLDRSCQRYVNASPKGRRQFWSFEEIRQEELGGRRALTKKNAVAFVLDSLLGPIYNGRPFLTVRGVWMKGAHLSLSLFFLSTSLPPAWQAGHQGV